MKALLLRVGIDKGTDGCLAPVFHDLSFEYIPLSESEAQTTEKRTFMDVTGKKGKPLSAFLPPKVRNRKIHFDPEFETFTYGDKGTKAKWLKKLNSNDLLVFYAGLTPYKTNYHPEALYIIGYFKVAEVVDFNNLPEKEKDKYCAKYFNNAHIKRNNDLEDTVIIIGDKNQSKLLDNAIIISETRLNRIGRKYHAVSKEIEQSLGIRGSIQRSIPPRMIEDKRYIDNLIKLLQINY